MHLISSEIIIFYCTDFPENQPAGLHLASGIQSSCMKSRQVVSQSKIAEPKLHSIKKDLKATWIVCVLLTLNTITDKSLTVINDSAYFYQDLVTWLWSCSLEYRPSQSVEKQKIAHFEWVHLIDQGCQYDFWHILQWASPR